MSFSKFLPRVYSLSKISQISDSILILRKYFVTKTNKIIIIIVIIIIIMIKPICLANCRTLFDGEHFSGEINIEPVCLINLVRSSKFPFNELKSTTGHWELPGVKFHYPSNAKVIFKIANWFASYQLGFLTMLCFLWIIWLFHYPWEIP